MYAVLHNELDVILFLMDFEGMIPLQCDTLVKSTAGAFYVPQGSYAIHLAAVCAEQYVIDAFFQFYYEHNFDVTKDVSVSRMLILNNKKVN